MAKRLSSTITKHAFRNGSETGNTSHRHLPCRRRRSYGGDESRRPASKSLDTACAPAWSKKAKFCAPKLWALCFNFEFYGTLWAALVKSSRSTTVQADVAC